jgi:hypothetical protein
LTVSSLYPGVLTFEMLLLIVSRAVWKASNPETPVDNISPIG